MNFLGLIYCLDSSREQKTEISRLEPRRTRREKARAAAKINRSVGAQAAPTSSLQTQIKEKLG